MGTNVQFSMALISSNGHNFLVPKMQLDNNLPLFERESEFCILLQITGATFHKTANF